jgi:hypothetical protein
MAQSHGIASAALDSMQCYSMAQSHSRMALRVYRPCFSNFSMLLCSVQCYSMALRIASAALASMQCCAMAL